MEEGMNDSTVSLVLGIAGFALITMFGIIGFFLRMLHTDMKTNIEDTGKNKGNIELIRQQQEADTKRIEAMTQLELKLLSANVSDLSKNVNILVNALAQKAIKTDEK